MFKNYYISNFLIESQFNKKVNFFIIPNSSLYLYELELIFRLPSVLQNKNRFILMLILIEKLINNKLIFLFDQRTLSRSKSIKIGCIVNLRKDILYSFINLYCMHNIPKFYKSEIIFEFSNSLSMKYEMQKILSNVVFNFDKDLTFYYDYLNEFDYSMSFFFKSIFNNVWLNKVLLNNFGINFYNSLILNMENVVINGWYLNLIDEVEEEENVEDFFLVDDSEEEIDENNILFFSYLFIEDLLEDQFVFDLNFEL